MERKRMNTGKKHGNKMRKGNVKKEKMVEKKVKRN